MSEELLVDVSSHGPWAACANAGYSCGPTQNCKLSEDIDSFLFDNSIEEEFLCVNFADDSALPQCEEVGHT